MTRKSPLPTYLPILTRPSPILQLEGLPSKTTIPLTPIITCIRQKTLYATRDTKSCSVNCRKATRRVSRSSTSLAIMTPCFITSKTNYCCVNCIPACSQNIYTLDDYMPRAKALGNYIHMYL